MSCNVFLLFLLKLDGVLIISLHQASGEDFSVEPTDTRRPFRALLDVGLLRTTTGNRVFAALKVI